MRRKLANIIWYIGHLAGWNGGPHIEWNDGPMARAGRRPA